MLRSILRILVSVVILMPGLAFAHPGLPGDTWFVHGFSHPLSGIDHLLAMIAVGVFAARLGGRALWLVPTSFVTMMVVGGALGMLGLGLPYVEIGIAASVIALGAAIALRRNLPVVLAMTAVGIFAVFHGHAHGTELPAAASAVPYAAGFAAATASLHLLGIAIGRFGARLPQAALRLAGGTLAAIGMVLLGAAL
jgi:urease accessory protein